VHAAQAIRLPDGIPLDRACLLGCGVSTGVGAAIQTAKVWPGANIAVIGLGGIGLAAMQGARIAGAERMIAIDIAPRKLGWAATFGATDIVDASTVDPIEAVRDLTGGEGVDFAFEMAGGAVFDACFAALAPFGRLVIYGIASGEGNEVHTRKLLGRSRSVVGFWLAHCLGNPAMVDEALADLYARAARGELRAVVSATYPLSEARQAQIDIDAHHFTGRFHFRTKRYVHALVAQKRKDRFLDGEMFRYDFSSEAELG